MKRFPWFAVLTLIGTLGLSPLACSSGSQGQAVLVEQAQPAAGLAAAGPSISMARAVAQRQVEPTTAHRQVADWGREVQSPAAAESEAAARPAQGAQ